MAARRLGAAAVAIALAVAGAGCSASPTTAATVGDRTVSMRTVDDTADHCGKYLNPNTMTPRQAVASTLIRGAIAQQVLDDRHITLTTTQRDGIAAKYGLTELMSDPVCRDMVRQFTSLPHLMDVEGQQKALKDFQAVDVTVNPRLGTWDTKNLATTGSSSLSQPFTQGS